MNPVPLDCRNGVHCDWCQSHVEFMKQRLEVFRLPKCPGPFPVESPALRQAIAAHREASTRSKPCCGN
jgi:hypothetical protein